MAKTRKKSQQDVDEAMTKHKHDGGHKRKRDEDGGAGDHVEGQPADITQYIDGVIKRMFVNHEEKVDKKFVDLGGRIIAIETDVQQLKDTIDFEIDRLLNT